MVVFIYYFVTLHISYEYFIPSYKIPLDPDSNDRMSFRLSSGHWRGALRFFPRGGF